MVVLLGSGGDGLDERRRLGAKLRERGVIPIIPEDDLSPTVAPSLAERDMLSENDIDLAFVNVQSWGSAAEFAEFRTNGRIAPKLRVLVPREFHPLYSSAAGYLTDSYMTHDAVFGHLYMHAGKEKGIPNWMPTAEQVVLKLSDRYRQWKAFSSR